MQTPSKLFPLDKSSPRTRRKKEWLSLVVHALRCAVFFLILVVAHFVHRKLHAKPTVDLPALLQQYSIDVRDEFGSDARIGSRNADDQWDIVNKDGMKLGALAQTSPQSDAFLGFSGSTNSLIALDEKGKVTSVRILMSRDTREHVEIIVRDDQFLTSWKGLDSNQVASKTDAMPVAGATLTSTAIIQGIQARFGAKTLASKFPEPISLEQAKKFFPGATGIEQDPGFPSIWQVHGGSSSELGWILRTSPVADNVVGYQGPTDTVMGFDASGVIVGIAIQDSFENEPYIGYVRKDRSFHELLKKFSLQRWTDMDLKQEGIEGVSGATMSSMAIAESLILAAKSYTRYRETRSQHQNSYSRIWKRSAGTILCVLLGCAFALSSWRGNQWLRFLLQVLVVGYLGLLQGELLSVAMIVGWAQNGIPLFNAFGFVVLALAAFVFPITTKRNVYCSHLCPHGAVQQMIPRSLRWKNPLPKSIRHVLLWLRPLLVAWVVCVMFLGLKYSLVDIEPFDAYVWRVAALPSIAIAIVGLLFSFLIPMGYCQYGCVTGSVLNYVRFSSRSDQLRWSDLFAILTLVFGLFVWWIG